MSSKLSLLTLGVGAALLCAGYAAAAQESANSVIGPPQLKDFSLDGRREVVQPAPQQQPPARTEPPPARAERPIREAPVPTDPQRQEPAQARVESPAAETAATETPVAEAEASTAFPVEEPATETAVAPAETDRGSGASIWMFALPAAALALFGVVLVRRRRRNGAAGPALDLVPAAAVPPPALRPDPVPRPWLELSLKAERAAFTAAEAELLFELEIANKGGSAARNLRIDVKMFNAGAEQDKEIGAFFKTAGRETTKLSLPEVPAGVVGVIKGSVRLPVAEMKAVKLDQRLLFIPVVAVNALYDYGEGRTGQTGKSYLIGREVEQGADKMGPFRVDQGPRVWRTVGQRPHSLAKRV